MKRRDFVRGMAAVGATRLVGDAPRLPSWALPKPASSTRLDDGWRFHLGDASGAESPQFDDAAWERVSLPHAARIEALVTGEAGSATAQWQGLCWYRRRVACPHDVAGRRVLLRFEAAMNVAEVWIDGRRVGGHEGGFLPFTLDVTHHARPGGEVVLAVRLDNRDDPVTGPKPLRMLDFNMYHGLYRYVHLVVKDRLHITDPLLAGRPGSGGVFVTYPAVSASAATVRVQVHVRNDHAAPRTLRVRCTLLGMDGRRVAGSVSDAITLPPGGDAGVVRELEVASPRLWSPAAPNLYVVRTEVVSDGDVVDVEHTRVGIRRIAIGREGFRINGERLFLRGTNRHQEHPYVGFAVPEDAQYRDARRIKDAGFDYIRLSHYPHAPAFMDACDELGIVVMNCLPGWQYFGPDPRFAELQYRNTRDLVRRDRNHPCVVLWEVSLNETAMPKEFIARTHAIAHEEYPGGQMYTCGWVPGYDVFIRARQHGGCPPASAHPCVVSEYGDWEYYAMTAGLDQESWTALAPGASNSRQLRWQGERAQLQQAANFQEAHDDNLGGAAFGDGLWVMYDYDRGYSPDVESSGCADIFRVPKYSYHFFRSQRDVGEAMVFIASEWTRESSPAVRVFSNAEEVELRLNGGVVARQGPDRDRMSTHLAHPPFTFAVGRFVPGTLEAIAYRHGRAVARHRVRTPGAPAQLTLEADLRGRAPSAAGRDLLFLHAALRDAHGTVIASAWENVAFGATGRASLVGHNPFATDAGIASILCATVPGGASAAYALAIVREAAGARLLGASLGVTGRAAPFTLVYGDASEASGGTRSSYRGVITGIDRVRASLVVAGRVVATLEEGMPRVRMQPNAPPSAREPFRRS